MLLKINHIKNVGRFYEVTPKGTPESSCSFERFSLIYADNGTGKTTLGAIIKSVAYDEPERILTRKTIASDGPCEVSIQIDNKTCNFLNNKWGKLPDSKFAIFDEEFIEKNIYSAAGVDTNHKRELFNYVVLGEENVDKFREFQSLTNDKIPVITKEITTLESQLRSKSDVENIKTLLNTKELSLEDFEKLKSIVGTKETQIKNSEAIKTNKALDKLSNVTWPEYKLAFAEGLDEVGNIEIYKAHINDHQQWIKEGLAIQKSEEKCPYCFQNLVGNEAIKAYKNFFSDQCQKLINKLGNLLIVTESSLSDDKILLVEKTIKANNNSCGFWHAMDKDIMLIPFMDEYSGKFKKYREMLKYLIEHKQKNILQPIKLTEADQIVLKISDELNSAINNYNNAVDSMNVKIAMIKAQHINLDMLKTEYKNNLAMLKCQMTAFHTEETKRKLAHYQQLLLDKKKLTDRLNILRTEINSASLELLKNYESSINKLLKFFGVEFRIGKVERRADTARRETLVFTIELKGMTFDPNGSLEMPYTLTNTLSSGDRSTLAFALFVAKLQYIDLSNTVIVFDDPISSLDFFRKQQTNKQISEISTKAKQVIVLTHSMEFTKLFGHIPIKAKYFKLNKIDSMAGVTLTPYDKLSDMCVSKHYEEHEILGTYLNAPTSVKRIDVMKSIRSYVETKLCFYLPELARLKSASLGNFIAHLKYKQIEQSYINELELINDSIVIENHGGDLTADDHRNLTDDELRNLCRLALELSAPLSRDDR